MQSDPASADNPQRAPAKIHTPEFFVGEFSRQCGLRGLADPAGEREHERERVFRHRVLAITADMGDLDFPLRASRKINMVEPHRAGRNQSQGGMAIEKIFIDPVVDENGNHFGLLRHLPQGGCEGHVEALELLRKEFLLLRLGGHETNFPAFHKRDSPPIMDGRPMETSMVSKGVFLTFEGSEGCGKSTQISLLEKTLQARGQDPLLVREPGGTPSGEAIRHLLQHSPEGEALTSESELLLFAASRAQLVREVIRPALFAGRTVISDRFLDSTTVYQGVARKIPPEVISRINAFAVGVCLPDMTFLPDLDRADAIARMAGRNPDRIERESEGFFEAVRRGYLELAARETHRFRVLDASRPPEEIAARIVADLTGSGFLR